MNARINTKCTGKKMLKITQETLNLGFMRRIMLSVLVWAIGVIYHVDVYASWHIGWVATSCTTYDDGDYIFRSGKNENDGANCCNVAYSSYFYYAPIKVLNKMVWVYNKSEGSMSTLMARAGEREDSDTTKVVCMDKSTRDAMISFFAQSCYNYYPNPEEQPNVYTTICESSDTVRESFYGTSIVIGQPALTTSNVHMPKGDSLWHNRRRFSCDRDIDVSDFYGGAFTTGAIYLTGYAYPVLLVGGGFSSAYENLYTGDCKLKSEKHPLRLDPNLPCWTSSGVPYAGGDTYSYEGCLKNCPEGYYCPPGMSLGDFFLNSTVSREEYIGGVLTSFYENGRNKYGGAFQCEPGSYNSDTRNSSCKSCAVGTYQPLYAQSACNTCPSTSQYDSSGSLLSDNKPGITSDTGAKYETDCYVDATFVSNGKLLEGKIGLFTFTGECYYS